MDTKENSVKETADAPVTRVELCTTKILKQKTLIEKLLFFNQSLVSPPAN